MTKIDPRQLRDACGHFGTGVTIITTHCDNHDHGMTANAFMSISLDPPLIAISIAEKAKMLACIRKSGRFAVSVLAEGMEALAWHFAGRPNPELGEVFEHRQGLPVIVNAAATFVTEVADEIEAGDHTIFVGKVNQLSSDPGCRPLLFFRGTFGGLAHPQPAPVTIESVVSELIW